ncbi:helix-turn-helix domain-containing protein [Streptomyces sp. PsTaAH-124]|uniref:helix-turn-helix domain-containing protein n=1 Tax=Streptomyces sp. PsTaAH-124 TaxID=1157638 RepID=UPI00037E9D30|nr:XRE family transcriptional regulator [Streptomyces sp. PsTaAH-124]
MTGPAPECAALAEGLRAVRARTGLSLTALAGRTAYSRSSWQRYLNGRLPVPRQAVEALCAMAGEPPGRLLALWELADAEWSGRARSAQATASYGPDPYGPDPYGPDPRGPVARPAPPASVAREPAPPSTVRPRRPRRRPLLLAAASAAVVAAALTAALSAPTPGPGRTALQAPALDPAPGCHGTACAGKDPALMACGLPGRAEALGAPHRTGTGASVEIRYSQVCAAAWGRIWHSHVGDSVEISAPGTPSRRVVVTGEADTRAYRFTPMLGDPDQSQVRLCFVPAPGTAQECFRP